jgi:hypothetical protein
MLQGLFNFLVFMSPKVRNAKRPIRGRKNLTWRQAFIKAYTSRGERRKTGRNLRSRNTRAGSRLSAWKQRVRRSLKSFLSRTRSTTRRDTRSNESNAACLPKNVQSNTTPKQVSAPAAEKLTSINPHLADGDMKDVEGNNTMRPQQQEEFLATDGDDEEKCEEQKALSHLGQKKMVNSLPLFPPSKRGEN